VSGHEKRTGSVGGDPLPADHSGFRIDDPLHVSDCVSLVIITHKKGKRGEAPYNVCLMPIGARDNRKRAGRCCTVH